MKINLANIKKARNLLNKRECVAIPTETVYGIAGNAYSDTACKKIFRLKKRPMNNPLIIHYYDLKKLKNDCDLNADFLKLYKRFCPGPITFILNQKKKSKISKVATNKKNTLAVRFPKHPVARILLKYLKFPIAAPSANISSRVSAVTSSDVKDDFGKKIKYILEGGRSSVGVESTIIDLRKKPKILSNLLVTECSGNLSANVFFLFVIIFEIFDDFLRFRINVKGPGQNFLYNLIKSLFK